MQSPNLISPSKTIDKTKGNNENKYSGTLVYVLIGTIICLILIIGALVLSPSSTPLSEKTLIEEVKAHESINDSMEVVEQKELIKNKKVNEKIEIDWMLKKIDAENNKMPIWSVENYDKALEFEVEAIRLNDKKEYQQSKERYIDAIKIIEDSLVKKEQIFNELLLEATHYLNEDDLEQSIIHFIKAKAIHEDNTMVKRGLVRINNRKDVIKIYEQALAEEKNDNLINSIKYLNKALLIEPEYLKVINKLSEIKEKKSKIDFNNAVSQVLEAIDISNLSIAREQLDIAKKINPNELIIEQLEAQIIEKNNSIEIKRLKRLSKIQEKKEQWKSAKRSYDRIIKIDPNTSFAIMGKERSNYYIHLNQLIDDIILKPHRLQNNKIFEKSKKSVNYVKNEIVTKNKIPKLKQKTLSAEKMIKEASMLISVIMKSDNETDVVIYQVEKFGKFNEKNIQLRPGKYTIVGSKEGYRDYRSIIDIYSNDDIKLINVMCKDKI